MLDLAIGLRERRADTRIACPGSAPLAERARKSGISVVPVEKGKGALDSKAIAAIRDLLRSGEVEIVHAHNGRTRLIAAIARKQARGGRLISTQHFLTPDHVGRTGLHALLSRAAHRWVNGEVSCFIAISESVRAGMLARAEAPESRITLIPNGIATPEVENLLSGEAVRCEQRVLPGAPLVASVARLEPEKDVSSLVSAFATVRRAFPDAVCLVAGEGREQHALRQQIRTEGLEGAVRLIGFRTDPLSIVAASDLFVLPSVAEPFGLALLEAMALGKPVVACRAGGPCEIVEDGKTGLLVPPRDPAALASAIRDLLGDSDRARAMGEAGRVRFEQQFTREQMAKATLEVYAAALGAG